MTEHHWIGCTPNPHDYFGFIYLITDLTSGRMYLGKRQYWSSRQRIKGCKSKVTDRQSPKWKPCCWSESDWRFYKGSSKSFAKWQEEHPNHEYEYRIIRECRCRGTLHYAEVEAQVKCGALTARDSDGEKIFFNRQIAACKFVPPIIYKDEWWLVDLGGITL